MAVNLYTWSLWKVTKVSYSSPCKNSLFVQIDSTGIRKLKLRFYSWFRIAKRKVKDLPRIIPISVDQFKEKWRIKSIYAYFSYHILKVLKSFETGISDHHHLIATVFKTTYKKFPPKLLTNRSYKHSWNDSLINKFKSEAYEIQSGDIGSLKHSSEHFKACSFHRSFFEPVTFLTIFHPFVLNWPLQEQVHFRSWYLQRVNYDKRNFGPITETGWEP